MTVIELQARKATLIQDILNSVDSEEGISKLERLTKKIICASIPEPGVFTDEEKLAWLEAAREDVRCGRVYTHEEVVKMVESWNR